MNTKPTEQEIPTPRTDALVNQRFVDHIVARAQNCMMGLGDPKTSYSLDKYADKTMECVALLLVDAHVAKYDLVSLMWAAMEEVAEHGRTLERELTLSQTKLAEVEKERDERKRQCVDWSNNHKRIMEVLRRVEQERDTLSAENARLKVELSSLANMVLDSRQNVGAPMRQKASACLKLSLAPENFPTVSDSGKEGTPETDTPETDAEAWFDNDEGWWVSISLARRLERGRNCYQAQCLLFEEERNAALRDLAAERERKSLYIMTDDNLRTALERAQADLAAAKDRLAKIDAAVNADAEDMAKMRDGTKLTRSGLVEVIIEQNLQLAAARETIAQVTRERNMWNHDAKTWEAEVYKARDQRDSLRNELSALRAERDAAEDKAHDLWLSELSKQKLIDHDPDGESVEELVAHCVAGIRAEIERKDAALKASEIAIGIYERSLELLRPTFEEHASQARHNEELHGMMQGPCMCAVCKAFALAVPTVSTSATKEEK